MIHPLKSCYVVIPAHNEEASIAHVIHKVPRSLTYPCDCASGEHEVNYQVSILVVNDGSTDTTKNAAVSAGALQ